MLLISIHALREEGDPAGGSAVYELPKFLSTPSARRATEGVGQKCAAALISIHALREEGDAAADVQQEMDIVISIHALREEGDRGAVQPRAMHRPISIHALREEGDGICAGKLVRNPKFLSTPSARRATAKTETKSLFSNKLYNILHEFRRALIYNGSKNYPNHAK